MRTKKDFDHQNEYNRQKYDHLNIMLPKGKKAELQELAERLGMSLNGMVKIALDEYIKNCTVQK